MVEDRKETVRAIKKYDWARYEKTCQSSDRLCNRFETKRKIIKQHKHLFCKRKMKETTRV